jgi:hypothetical protein
MIKARQYVFSNLFGFVILKMTYCVTVKDGQDTWNVSEMWERKQIKWGNMNGSDLLKRLYLDDMIMFQIAS